MPFHAVLGAGGFIGGHLTRRLAQDGHHVRAVDIKPLDRWQMHTDGVDELQADCSNPYDARLAVRNAEWVFNLAANMGGIGFIEANLADCAMSVLISANVLDACREYGTGRLFYSSSACVYPAAAQETTGLPPLAEHMALPADPEPGYGWEKLFSEHLHECHRIDYGMDVRVARFHNIYGPHTEYEGGREKAPAALCRKVALAGPGGLIDVWGVGSQVRSFCYVDDCVEGVMRLMDSNITEPLNIGSSESVTIDQLIDIIEEAAGYPVHRNYDLSAAQGVAGRNSDNTMIKLLLGWEPSTPLAEGIQKTFRWVQGRVAL